MIKSRGVDEIFDCHYIGESTEENKVNIKIFT